MNQRAFVYFDLGNVLVRFDPDRACRNLAHLTGCEPTQVHQAVYESNLQWQYEAGQLSGAEFAAAVNVRLKTNVPQEELLQSLANMFWWDTALFPTITRLICGGVRVGLLSNTCEAHWLHLVETGPALLHALSPLVLSYEQKCIKPDAEIYRVATRLAGTTAENIFFTDDRPENVAAAEASGWKAHLYQDPRSLMRWMSREGLSVFV